MHAKSMAASMDAVSVTTPDKIRLNTTNSAALLSENLINDDGTMVWWCRVLVAVFGP